MLNVLSVVFVNAILKHIYYSFTSKKIILFYKLSLFCPKHIYLILVFIKPEGDKVLTSQRSLTTSQRSVNN